eukprot:6110028-Heterocapsa_arctica.AAC.1
MAPPGGLPIIFHHVVGSSSPLRGSRVRPGPRLHSAASGIANHRLGVSFTGRDPSRKPKGRAGCYSRA